MGTVEVLAATAAVVFGLALVVLSYYAVLSWVGASMWSWGASPSRAHSAFVVGVAVTTIGYWIWLVLGGMASVGQ